MRWWTVIGAGAALYYLAGRGRQQERLSEQGRTAHLSAGTGQAGGGSAAHLDDDARLAARVHSALGHVSQHAHDILVHAERGEVTLSGTVWQSEEAAVLQCTGQIEGVQRVNNQLRAVGLPDDMTMPQEQPPHMLVTPHDHPSPPGFARDKP